VVPKRCRGSTTARRTIPAGVELRTGCRVREITINKQGMATEVVYYDAD
jgi:hypothetical protein